MSQSSAPGDDQRLLAESLRQLGADVSLNKSGRIRRIDFRAIAGCVDDAVIRTIAHSAKLQELYLDQASITVACVDDLLTLVDLRVLDVQRTTLDDMAIQRLVRLPNLNMLLVRGTAITAEGVRAIRRQATRVRIVSY